MLFLLVLAHKGVYQLSESWRCVLKHDPIKPAILCALVRWSLYRVSIDNLDS